MGGVVVAEAALLVLMFREDLTSGFRRASGLTGDTRTRRMLDPGSAWPMETSLTGTILVPGGGTMLAAELATPTAPTTASWRAGISGVQLELRSASSGGVGMVLMAPPSTPGRTDSDTEGGLDDDVEGSVVVAGLLTSTLVVGLDNSPDTGVTVTPLPPPPPDDVDDDGDPASDVLLSSLSSCLSCSLGGKG